MNDKNYIEVLLIKPMKKPEVVQMEDSLDAMQEIVGGWIEEYMPFEEEVAIVCNEEGKINGEPLNRAIVNEKGELQDIIAGSFFICSAPIESESFQSLSEEQIERYTEKFKYPEMFFRGEDGNIIAKKVTASPRNYER